MTACAFVVDVLVLTRQKRTSERQKFKTNGVMTKKEKSFLFPWIRRQNQIRTKSSDFTFAAQSTERPLSRALWFLWTLFFSQLISFHYSHHLQGNVPNQIRFGDKRVELRNGILILTELWADKLVYPGKPQCVSSWPCGLNTFL